MTSRLWDDVLATITGLLGPHGPAKPAVIISYSSADNSIHLFLQLAIILLSCYSVGWLCRTFLRQPQVVGEMIAGVLLGPSLFGILAPGLQTIIFPPETRNLLYAGGQLGVGLYMFLVGASFEAKHFRSMAHSAAAVSAAGIIVPFAVAWVAAPILLEIPGLFTTRVTPVNAFLFLGACIALTAFPMLARIIHERGLNDSPLGTLCLTAGAFDDACSWCVLAVVLATFDGGPGLAIVAIGGGITYTLALMTIGRRLLAGLARASAEGRELGAARLSIVLALFCISAFLMDAVGIHAIFGGFILGVAMPRGAFARELRQKLEPVTVALLLPMFFTYSGLNTRLLLIDTLTLWVVALSIVTVSIFAKGGACYLAARACGEDHSDALAIGALMNSRGLMELIIINIGVEKGIIGPALFSTFVLMAVGTTVMAAPLFELAQKSTQRISPRLVRTSSIEARAP